MNNEQNNNISSNNNTTSFNPSMITNNQVNMNYGGLNNNLKENNFSSVKTENVNYTNSSINSFEQNMQSNSINTNISMGNQVSPDMQNLHNNFNSVISNSDVVMVEKSVNNSNQNSQINNFNTDMSGNSQANVNYLTNNNNSSYVYPSTDLVNENYNTQIPSTYPEQNILNNNISTGAQNINLNQNIHDVTNANNISRNDINVANNPNSGVSLNHTNNKNNNDNILSVKSYFGYMFLFNLPIIGFIMQLVKAVGEKKNKNISNFAKAQLLFSVIITVIMVLFVVTIMALYISYSNKINDAIINKDLDDIVDNDNNYNDTNNTFDGTLIYGNYNKIEDIFEFEVPSSFENKSISTSIYYTYGNESIFEDCTFELNSISGYNSSKKLIEEMSTYYNDSIYSEAYIKNIKWYTFEDKGLFGGVSYYYATDIDDIVYLYNFEINNEDIINECKAYHNSIIASFSLK